MKKKASDLPHYASRDKGFSAFGLIEIGIAIYNASNKRTRCKTNLFAAY